MAISLTEKAWQVIKRWPLDREFKAAEVAARLGCPARSAGGAMRYLILDGRVEKLDKMAREHGSSLGVALYRRTGATAPEANPVRRLLEPEGEGGVRRKDMGNGVTRVSHGVAWRPYREPRSERPWRGYESSLAKV